MGVTAFHGISKLGLTAQAAFIGGETCERASNQNVTAAHLKRQLNTKRGGQCGEDGVKGVMAISRGAWADSM